MPDAPKWLNTNSAAAYLGITPTTLHRLVQEGEVVGNQIGRVRRYRLHADGGVPRLRRRPRRPALGVHPPLISDQARHAKLVVSTAKATPL